MIPGAGPAVRRINRAGIPAICVTNQPEIAKGRLRVSDLEQVFAALDTHLARDGAYLDDRFFCPHHPEKGWPGEVPALKIACSCRKPEPGMLVAAAEAHGIDLSRSWMIGDRHVDARAAHAVGARAALVRTGHGGSDLMRPGDEPDHVADDVAAAVDHILKVIA